MRRVLWATVALALGSAAAGRAQTAAEPHPQSTAAAVLAAANDPDAEALDPVLVAKFLLAQDLEANKGPNFDLEILSVHSSVTGWSMLWVPSVSWRFNRHLALGAALPWYWDIKNYIPVTVKDVTTYPLEPTQDVIGDMSVSGQLLAERGNFHYMLLLSGAFPTGDSAFGLSANAPTYNFTNHLEETIGPVDLYAELGEGDSTSLAADAVTHKSYVAVGPVANYLAGAAVRLPHRCRFDFGAYEQMPLGNQNVYGTVTKKVKGKNVTTQVLEGTGVAEDNGLQGSLMHFLNRQLSFSVYYERSLRQGTDTLALGFNWLLRVPHGVRFH